MGENQTTKKALSPIIIALAIIFLIAIIFFTVSGLLKVGNNNSSFNNGFAPGVNNGTAEKITSSANQESIDIALQGIAKATKNGADYYEKESDTVINPDDRKDGSTLTAGSQSNLIKGFVATNRWTATNIISSVVAERVAVDLDVYDGAVKTSQKKTRYLYIAEITTKPSRVSVIAASQYTENNIDGINAIVKGFESAENQDIIFASSNEMCASDLSNPFNNVFYNESETATATVIKNCSIAQRGELSANSLTINKDGTWNFPVRVSMSTCEELIKKGTIASVSYTYPAIWKGEKYNHPNFGVNTGIWNDHSISAQQLGSNENKTMIGKISNDKYIVLVSDGFGYGYLAEYMLNNLGVQYAYWGGSGVAAAMYIKGYGVITPNNYIVHGDLFCIR